MTHAAYRFFRLDGSDDTARWQDKLDALNAMVWVIPGAKKYHDHNPANPDYADRVRSTSCGSPEDFAEAVQMTVIEAVLRGYTFCAHCALWNSNHLPHVYGKVIRGAATYRVTFTGLEAVNPDKKKPYIDTVQRIMEVYGIHGVREVKPGVYEVPDSTMAAFAEHVIHGFVYDHNYSKRRGYGLMKFTWKVNPINERG